MAFPNPNFAIPGLMEIQTPRADLDGANVIEPPIDLHGFFVSGTVGVGDEIQGELVHDVVFKEWQIVSNGAVPGTVELDVWVTTNGATPTVDDSICDGRYPAIVVEGTTGAGTTGGFSTTGFSEGDKYTVKIRAITGIVSIFFSLTDS